MNNCDNCAKVRVCRYQEDFVSITKRVEDIIPIGIVFSVTVSCGEWLGIVTTSRLVDFSQKP